MTTTSVVYSARPETPGLRYFRCERMLACISTDSCASMWRRTNDEAEGAREACRRCPLGAEHAGEAQASLSPMRLEPMCARCHRGSRRLIAGMHCVSCYNREREFVSGRNAKGTTPVKLTCLARRRVRFVAGGQACTLVMQRSVDTEELIVATMRDSKQRVRFGFGAAVQQSIPQLRLF